MAKITIPTSWDIPTIVADAGGDLDKARYEHGDLIVDDVTQGSLDAVVAGFDTAANDARNAVLVVQNTRATSYASWRDQLDMQFHDLLDGTTTWRDHVAAVKAANPKP